jgi:hypothetical protein
MQGLFALAKDEMGKLMAAMPGGPPKGPAPHRKPHESMDFEDTESRGWRKVSNGRRLILNFPNNNISLVFVDSINYAAFFRIRGNGSRAPPLPRPGSGSSLLCWR